MLCLAFPLCCAPAPGIESPRLPPRSPLGGADAIQTRTFCPLPAEIYFYLLSNARNAFRLKLDTAIPLSSAFDIVLRLSQFAAAHDRIKRFRRAEVGLSIPFPAGARGAEKSSSDSLLLLPSSRRSQLNRGESARPTCHCFVACGAENAREKMNTAKFRCRAERMFALLHCVANIIAAKCPI